jgi:diguanylate cyclase
MEKIRQRLKKFMNSGVSAECKGVSGECKHEFSDEILKDNFSRLSVFSIVLFFIELTLFILPGRIVVTKGVFLSFLISCVFFIPLIFYINKNIHSFNKKFAWIVTYLYSFVALELGCFLALVSQRDLDLGHVYLMAVISVACFIYMSNTGRAVLLLLVYLGFIYLLPQYQQDTTAVFVIKTNSLIFNILAWIMGALLIRTRASSFLYKKELHEKNIKLKDLAQRDSMTNLLNHEASFDRLREEINRSRRMQYPLSIIIADIDNFKKINDNYGHLVGDSVIKKIADIIVKHTRNTDIVGRYGGEEFIVIMPDTDMESAKVLADRILSAMKKADLGIDMSLTLSGGISQFKNESLDELIRSADSNLYKAKTLGKNRFEI